VTGGVGPAYDKASTRERQGLDTRRSSLQTVMDQVPGVRMGFAPREDVYPRLRDRLFETGSGEDDL